MSLEARLAQLEFEVAELRALVEVQGRLLRRLVGDSARESEFELVSEASPAVASFAAEPRVESSASATHSGSSQAATPPAPLSHSEREEVARSVGRFLHRALTGQALGTSGRDRNPLRSRVYLICRDFEGADVLPPIVSERFSEVSSRCKRGSECGRAVFVGLPSRWEARLALEEANLPTTNL